MPLDFSRPLIYILCMVSYLKLLSTILSRGVSHRDFLTLSGQVIQIKSLPSLNVDWQYTVNEYVAARNGYELKRSYRSTWDTHDPIQMSMKLRNIRTSLKANGTALLTDNGHSLYFHKNGKKIDLSVHIGSVNVLDSLPYNLAAIGLVWRVLSYETKNPIGNLTVLIGDAWIFKDAKAKEVLIAPLDRRKQDVKIRKKPGEKFDEDCFKLLIKEIVHR